VRHFDIITDILSTVNVGQPVLTIKLNGTSNLRVIENSWSANITERSFHHDLAKDFAKRKMVVNDSDKGYAIDLDSTLSNIKDHVLGSILKIYSDSCPNKEPRRTKLYRQIYSLVRSANRPDKTELLNFMFDIAQYADSVTREFLLTNPSNEVHRKNIYKLFEIMESKHGSKESSIR
jgi:hypothetical protein